MHLTDVDSVHPYSVRICHWINLVACAYLVWSGIHIFLDFPELYWGHTGYRDYPAAFRLADWGLSWDEAGALGDRRWGRNYHFTFAWVFLINGFVYVGWNLYSRHFRNQMLPARGELTIARVLTELRQHFQWPRRHVCWQLRHAAEDLVPLADLRLRAADDRDRHRPVPRLYGGHAMAAGPVRRSSDGADAPHRRHPGARAIRNRPRRGSDGGGIRQSGSVDDHR